MARFPDEEQGNTHRERETQPQAKTDSIMVHLRLKYIGEDFNRRPEYKEVGGSVIYVDVNMAKKKGMKPRICDTIPKSGEPNCPFIGSYTLEGMPWTDEPITGTQTWQDI